MPTIETAFVILDRGASATIGNLRREVRGLEDDAERAGRAMDHLADRDGSAEMESRAAATRNFAGSLRDVSGRVSELNPKLLTYNSRLQSAETRTKALRLETEGLAAALGRVSQIRATAHADVDGLAQARVDLAAFKAELLELGRMRVSASASASTFGVGGGGGGGGFGGRGGLFSARNALRFSPILLPGAQALIGGAGGLLGSAGAGAVGAGAVGGAAGAVGAVGLLGALAIGKPAAESLKEATKAQEAWADALRDFGEGSKEAKEAKLEYDRALADNPGMKRALQETRAFNREWREATRAGREDYFGMREDRAAFGRRMSGFFGGGASRIVGAVRDAQSEQMDRLGSQEAMEHLDRLSRVFVNDLPIAERSLGHLEMTFLQLSRAALPFFHEANLWIEDQTRDWNRATSDIGEVREGMGDLLQDTRAWGRVLGSAGDVLAELSRVSRRPGRSMVEDVDATLQRWDGWLERNPRAAEQWFGAAADNTERIADALTEAVSMLDKLATELGPVLQGGAALVGGVSSLGLAAPGAIALALGARAGARGAFGGGGGIGAAGAAGAGAAGAAGAAAAGRVDWGRLRSAGAGGYGWARSQGASPWQAAQAGRRSMATSWGRQGLPGSGTVGGGTLRGAAGRFLPIGVGLGALGAIGWDGSFGEQAQVFGSTLTLGAIDRPTSASQNQDAASRSVDAFAARRLAGLPATMSGTTRGLGTIDAELARLQAANANRRGVGGSLANIGTNVGSLGLDWGMSEADKEKAWGISDKQFEFNEQRIRLLREEREELAKLNADHRKGLDRRHAGESAERGAALTESFGQSYDTLAAQYGQEKAFDKTVKDVFGTMSSMRREGAKILGENTLAWAQAQAKANPELLDEFEWLTRNIERNFSRLGRRVKIYNGQIFEGTRAEWKNIAAAMIDPAEQARQEVTEAFTDIQNQASTSLQAMGFTPGSARRLIRDMERGNRSGASAADRQAGQTASGIIEITRVGQQIAGGGPQGDGLGWGDGLGNNGRSSAAARQRSGGQTSFAATAAGGASGLMGANPALAGYADAASGYGLRVSSGARPGAITNAGNRSYHSSGDALDLAGPPDAMMRFAQFAAERWGGQLEELIYSPLGWSIKDGRRVPAYAVADHWDHVHMADTAPGGVGGVGGAGFQFSPDTAGPGMQQISLKPPKSGAGGIAGVLADAAITSYAVGLEQKLNESLGGWNGSMAGGGQPYSGGGTMSQSQIAALAAQVGFPDPNLAAAIFMAESGGRVGVVNSIGATGLAQILQSAHPQYDPARLASDPLYNLQAAYAISSGGTNWQPWEAYTLGMHRRFMGQGDGIGHVEWGGWHKDGLDATFSRPTIIGVGEGDVPERVQVTPQGQASGGGAAVVFQAGAFQLSVGGELDKSKVVAIVEPLFVEFAQKVANGVTGSQTKELIA